MAGIVVGWIAWAAVAYLALTFAYGCRRYAAAGQGFQWATGVQTFLCCLFSVVFLIAPLNKLHLIWLVPVGFFGAQFVAMAGIPIVSPLILLATRIFLRVILMGVKAPDLHSQGPDRQIGGAQPKSTKTEFIKALVRQRLEAAGLFQQRRDTLDQMSKIMVMGLPEATLVTIVETYTELRLRGQTDEHIFAVIERHRRTFGPAGRLPSPLTLQSYVLYRLQLEHGHAVPQLTEQLVADAIRRSLLYFGG